MVSLESTADHHPLATERALRKAGIQQLSFGLGKRVTHRVIDAVDGNAVVIFRVRAYKQDEIALDDLD